MGCFLGCFGSSKDDRKRRKSRHKVHHRHQRNAGFSKPVESAVTPVQTNTEKPTSTTPVESTVSLVQINPEKSTTPAVEIRDSSTSTATNDKIDEQLSVSSRKRVTFDSIVTTYEHVSVEESAEFCVEKEMEDGGNRKEGKEENLVVKPSLSESSLEDGSVTSSSGSYPGNHRYQNCRDSDDELDYGDSDVGYEDDDGLDFDDEYEDGEVLVSGGKVSTVKGTLPFTEEVDSSVGVSSLPEREIKKPNLNARVRSGYVHSVLNPVENLTQWKAVKAKGTPQLKQQKENYTQGQEQPRISFSSDPSFKELSFSFKAKSDQPKTPPKQEIAVDASLSTWLGSSGGTSISKASTIGFESITTPAKSTLSVGSHSPKSFEDRPILGALTVEELKQFSASSSPRKSPCRSPDEMPIIGTVGTYWNHSVSSKNSGSASSFKGIPNTTSKYRGDKSVRWHATPFETRLERALNNGASGCHTLTYNVQ